MPGIDVNQLWTPARAVPSPQSDQKAPVTNVRGGRYGEQYVLPLIPTKHLLADELYRHEPYAWNGAGI